MARSALFNFNQNSLAVLERAVAGYAEVLAASRGESWTSVAGQPEATQKIFFESEYWKEIVAEQKQVELLKKQIAYQKRLLKM